MKAALFFHYNRCIRHNVQFGYQLQLFLKTEKHGKIQNEVATKMYVTAQITHSPRILCVKCTANFCARSYAAYASTNAYIQCHTIKCASNTTHSVNFHQVWTRLNVCEIKTRALHSSELKRNHTVGVNRKLILANKSNFTSTTYMHLLYNDQI